MPESWRIGVIGGAGLDVSGLLENAQEIPVKSNFGEPSAPVTIGTIAGVGFVFLPRRGKGCRIPPGQINYRANIEVLKRCRVTDIIAVSMAACLHDGIGPGEFAVIGQIIDQTRGRQDSFFGEGLAAQVGFSDPVCARLSGLVAKAARKAGARVHEGGCYLASQGPQFPTRAESLAYRAWGADVAGMTAMPEARLAREAELPYALLAMAIGQEPFAAGGDIAGLCREGAGTLRAMLAALARALPEARRPSPIDTALDGAILTAPEARDRTMAVRLGTIAGRVLGSG